LPLPLFLPLPVLFQPTIKDTSSRPKAAYFAAAAERSLYFALALVVVLAAPTVQQAQFLKQILKKRQKDDASFVTEKTYRSPPRSPRNPPQPDHKKTTFCKRHLPEHPRL
jgi:hypothetical protein